VGVGAPQLRQKCASAGSGVPHRSQVRGSVATEVLMFEDFPI
jgi:hypothetical protein